jgi:hypothetical protein
MVEAQAVDSTPRFRLLDTMRAFARERRCAEGADAAAKEGFLGWAIAFACWVDRTVGTTDEAVADVALRREVGNLRAAWALVRADRRLSDAVALACALDAAAGWRDLTEVQGWSLELVDDPVLAAHPGAATVHGIAADTAWARGELERAGRLARRGLELGSVGRWRCEAALALVALSRGEWADAVAHGTAAAELAPRPDQSLGVAALATAYGGDLRAATALNDQLGRIAVAPTLVAFHHYVAAEIAALATDGDAAERRYQLATSLARRSGSTFVAGVASVGLLTRRVAGGRVAETLTGYRDLIDYWERTSAWIQQWTTLRNLARLLRALDDDATAFLLDAAARLAPDAPPVDEEPDPADLPAEDVAALRARAASLSRARVLEIARAALARHAGGTGEPA